MNQKTEPDTLDETIETLYATFACYPLREQVKGCSHCVTEEDVSLLHAKPLRQLSSEDLARYAFKAITTWGTEDDFKHFLPRLLELVTADASITLETDCEVIFGKLNYTDWRKWPMREQQAIDSYFLALWRFLLAQSPEVLTIDDFLCSIAQAVDDIHPYLQVWEQTVSLMAISHFLNCLDWNVQPLQRGKLSNSFWSDRKPQMEQVVAWMLDHKTMMHFEENLDACFQQF